MLKRPILLLDNSHAKRVAKAARLQCAATRSLLFQYKINGSMLPVLLNRPKNTGKTRLEIGARCAAARGTKAEFGGVAGLRLAS